MARTNTNNGGGGGGGITSINSDSTAAQLITGGVGISTSTTSGDTTIDFTGVSTDGTTIIGDGANQPLQAIFQQSGKGIIYGGAAWSGTGYTFDVTNLSYFIDGVFYTANATQVTLAASDPSDDRFDVIVVDDTGTIYAVTGTPSTPPAIPELAWNEVAITTVLVEAGSTQPTISQDLIYNEDAGSPTEWVTSTYNIAGTQTGTVVFNSALNPYNGTVRAKATGTNLRRGMRFTRGTDINIQNYGFIQVPFLIETTALPTTKSPIIRFQNSGGTLIGNSVNLVTYGLNRSIVGTWQLIIIPITAFGNITNVRSLTAVVNGAGTADWGMDYIFLSGGIPPQSNLGPIFLSASGTLYSSGAATAGASSVNNSIFFGTQAGASATNAFSSIFLGLNAGAGATNAANSYFFGENAGYKALSATRSFFAGGFAGYAATNASQSIFIGDSAGQNGTNASDSVFLGYQAGTNATNAANALFFGNLAGYGATNASGSVFLGAQAGQNATDAAGSVFIGQQAGQNATNTAPSIAIGALSNTGAFNSSVAVGTSATATDDNQLMIGSSGVNINGMYFNGNDTDDVTVRTSKTSLTSAQVLTLNTTPVQLIPAPGAGKAIEVMDVIVRMRNVTTPYDTNTLLSIIFAGAGGSSGVASTSTNSNPLLLSADGIKRLIYIGNVAMNGTIVENTALQVTVQNGDPLNGDGDMDIYVTYKIITL